MAFALRKLPSLRNCGWFCVAKSPTFRRRKPQNAFERFTFQTDLQKCLWKFRGWERASWRPTGKPVRTLLKSPCGARCKFACGEVCGVLKNPLNFENMVLSVLLLVVFGCQPSADSGLCGSCPQGYSGAGEQIRITPSESACKGHPSSLGVARRSPSCPRIWR